MDAVEMNGAGSEYEGSKTSTHRREGRRIRLRRSISHTRAHSSRNKGHMNRYYLIRKWRGTSLS